MTRVVGLDADLFTYAAGFVLLKKEEEGNIISINDAHTILDTIIRKVLRGSKASHYLGYLTDSPKNFRIKRAVTVEYKGNRKVAKESKPIPFKKEMINYMIVHWGFQLVQGIEADDALTIAGEYFRDRDEQYILATKDKDLWQWDGEHYNMNTNSIMFIDKEQAHKNLWKQVITGDMGTDNIPGLSHAAKWEQPYFDSPKKRPLAEFLYGDKGVYSLLDSWIPEDFCKNAMELYLWNYGQWGDIDDEDYGIERFHEVFDLVYMLLEEPEGVTVKTKYRKCSVKDLEKPTGFEGYRPKEDLSGFGVIETNY
jgi:hypothetical protein